MSIQGHDLGVCYYCLDKKPSTQLGSCVVIACQEYCVPHSRGW